MDIRLLFFRNNKNDLEKIPIVASPPLDELERLNQEIADFRSQIKKLNREQRSLITEPEIRNLAAACTGCNLCMVCAGNHRRYESWPPGTGECFYTKIKAGKPIQDEPCELCEEHDKQLRNYNRDKRVGLSKMSTLKNKLNALIRQRRELFRQHAIEVEVISE